MIKTKTFELNSIRLSGKPVAYYDNSTRGGWDVTIELEIDDGKRIRIQVPLEDNKAPFSEADFRKGPVSVINASFNSYINSKTNRPVFQIKAARRGVILNTSINQNDVFVGGVVSNVNPDTRRFIMDVKHRKGGFKQGQKMEIGIRQVLVTCDDSTTLPEKDTEVIVTGSVHVTDTKMIGVKAAHVAPLKD